MLSVGKHSPVGCLGIKGRISGVQQLFTCFTEDFDEEDFVSECMDQVDEEYYADDYDVQAEEIVFSQAELNDVWVEDEDDE